MIVAAAVCPGPPLLFAELSGADPSAAELRSACTAAVADLLAAAPDVVVIIGAGERRQPWPAGARADLRPYGGMQLRRPDHVAPLSVGVGAALLDAAGHTGERLMWTVAVDDYRIDLVDLAPRVGLLAICDGSARRTVKAPGYLDERADPYDAEVRRALSTGDVQAVRRLDPVLAHELMAPGWPVLQALAAAFPDGAPPATVRYCDAPYGVGYLVACITSAAAG